MPRVVSKGSITGRSAFSNGGLGLSIGTRATKGIRHAISRRAPDNVKINGDPTPDYKIREVELGTPVLLTNTATPSKPYLTSMLFTYTGDPMLVDMFTNELQGIVLTFMTPSYSAEIAANAFTIALLPGTNLKLETLITPISKNNYTFTLPAMTYTATGATDIHTTALDVYYNGTAFNTATQSDTILVNVHAESGGITYAEFNAPIKEVLFGKTFNITLTADNVFNIPITGGINCGTYIYTAPAP